MFGLEDKKRKGDNPTQFDLELELKSAKKRRETALKVEERIAQLKAVLRSGQDQEEFDDVGVLLQGYAALLKVIGRFGEKPK
jgi:hypothetical protein